MDESYPIPAAKHLQTAAYIRSRVVKLQAALAKQLGPRYAVELRNEPAPSDETKGEIHYTVAVRRASTVGANLDLIVVRVEPPEETQESSAEESPRETAEVPGEATEKRVWVRGRAAGRLTDRIDRLVLKLGCIVLLLIGVVALVVALFPGWFADPWGRFSEWLAVVVLSYAILFAIIVPLPKRLLGMLHTNRELLATIHRVAESILQPEGDEKESAT